MSRVGAYLGRHHVALLALVLALGGTSYAAVSSRSEHAVGSLQSGETVRGTWAVSVGTSSGDPNSFDIAAISFPQPAPVRLDG